MNSKKRVLFCGESTFLSTGFAVYGREILSRLHSSGNYEIAELGNYGPFNDERSLEIPWKYYPVMPDPFNQGEINQYNSKPSNQHGEWKFEPACVDFKPDIVASYLDPWMTLYQEYSPFRPYYRHVLMPTIDSLCQDESWLASFAQADSVLSYTDWGREVLEQEGNGFIKTFGSAPPGVNLDVFRPTKENVSHKQSMGLPSDCLIVGTVMRNQKRKLFPDLIDTFSRLLKEAPRNISQKTYLYLHTYYPDIGWDIPRLIRDAGIGGRTLLTYLCQRCGSSFPSFYSDAKNYCRVCGGIANLANSRVGVHEEILNKIYNLMDVYVQYSSCEGAGMPQIEASSCGVPLITVDYSAMSDVGRKLGASIVKVLTLVKEAETGRMMAVPDNNDLLSKLVALLSLPSSIRKQKGMLAREAVKKYYTYDKSARVWMDCLDSLDVFDHVHTWNSPARLHRPLERAPNGLSDEKFVKWAISNVLGRPDLENSYLARRLTRDLNWGATTGNIPRADFNELAFLGVHYEPVVFNRQKLIEEMTERCNYRNHWEKIRGRSSVSTK